MLLFALGLTLITVVAFGIAPALRASRGAGLSGLRVGVRTGGAGGQRHFERQARDFTWAADFGGSPASIADENRAAGTAAWRLSGGGAHGSIAGYPAAESVRPGGLQRLYVRAVGAGWVRVAVYRMGWYGSQSASRMSTISSPIWIRR